ncbi:uncharacterized protein EV422DRAFT_566332 [Fimicolochytrium jonesii]|uniref:uncharacterized protein n=1 Tax=Fimicolochytrium jonesii TaxID=1396493 RepID=UPI0022FEE2E9|nr:uncharacterized protein EV422DRAFT_566332 [Fimicolochytrium jonesii]KAI8822657.1 hypothetical protein EV422DRAFT_566332 [Fimicolochytrium jonesii]
MTIPQMSPRDHFLAWMDAVDVADTTQTFDAMVAAANVTSSQGLALYTALKAALLPILPYRQKGLFTAIDGKLAATATLREESSPTGRILISGAGPCGLRSAVECALQGYHVTVLELRSQFSRHNIIKTWKTIIQDLTSLGLSQYMPAFQPHGHLHLETKQIQLVLLKTALLLGVRVQYDQGLCGLIEPISGVDAPTAWTGWSLPAAEAKAIVKSKNNAVAVDSTGNESADANEKEEMSEEDTPAELAFRHSEANLDGAEKRSKVDFVERASSQDGVITRAAAVHTIPSHAVKHEFDALLVAEGESSRLLRNLGFDRKYVRFAEAIGMVVNLEFSPQATDAKSKSRAPELQLPEFVGSRAQAEWRTGPLGKLEKLGVGIENMEYMRGLKTHFLVITVKRASLHEAGVLRNNEGTVHDVLSPTNVDITQLRSFARHTASSVGVPPDAPFCAQHGVQLFDFSAKAMTMQSLKFLSPADDPTHPTAVVLPIGDAFQNPFWPQGLGINRGFHTSLDAVYAAHLFITTHDTALVELERGFARRTSEWMAFAEHYCVQPNPAGHWTSDPVTRYAPRLYQSMYLSEKSDPTARKVTEQFRGMNERDLERKRAQIPVPERVKVALGLDEPR